MRPKIVSGIPLEDKKSMKQCWNNISSKRLDSGILFDKIETLLSSMLGVVHGILAHERNLWSSIMSKLY